MESPRPEPFWRAPWTLALLLPLSLAACGGGEPDGAGSAPGVGAPPAASEDPAPTAGTFREEQPETTGAGAAMGATTEGAPQAPAARERNFNPRAFEFDDWYDALAERVSPAKDGWPTEVIAQVAERDVQRMLVAALNGDFEGGLERLAEGFQGSADLRPETLEQRLADGNLHVQSGYSGDGGHVSAEGWPAALEALVAPMLNGVGHGVSVWVTSVLELEGAGFECELSVRAVSQLGQGSRQLNLNWATIWRLDPVRKEVLLEWVTAKAFDEVEYRERPFEELTGTIFEDRELLLGNLNQGAVEYTERYDRTAGLASVYLGMHGIAIGDVNGDGLEDLYVGRQTGVPNQLFLQTPAGTVREVGREARVDYLEDTAGVLVFDLDGDGARDLVMGSGPDLFVAWNEGEAQFSNAQILRGTGREQIYSLCAADADGDGDLDLYATRYVAGGVSRGLPTPYHDAENGASNFYWRNEGGRNFTLATGEVGLDQNNTRFSLSAMWEDVDRDGDLDLYVANDFGRNNLYRNDGGRFTDIADDVGAYDMAAGMGLTCADVEGDGDLDFYVSNMFTAAGSRIAGNPKFQVARNLDARGGYMHHTQGNSLLVNQGAGAFRDMTARAKAGPGGWAWGAMFTDFDNDGLPDIVVPNGFLTGRRVEDLEGFFWRAVVNASPAKAPATTEYQNAWVAISNLGQVDGYSWNGREPNYAYRNLGGGRFVDVSGASGLDFRDDARVAGVVDWDGDGRLDLWLKNRTAPLLRFVRNVYATPGHWVSLELEGVGANLEAAGALVTVQTAAEDGGARRVQRSYLGHGYLGSSSRRLHFGLGSATRPVRVEVDWPDGGHTVFEGVGVDRRWKLAQGATVPQALPLPASTLDALPAGRVPERLPEAPETWLDPMGPQITRVPLLDRLPLTQLELPTLGDGTRTIESFAGKNLLLLLWGGWNHESVADLRRLAEELEGSDVVLYPLSMDGVRDEAYVASVLNALPRARSGSLAGEVLGGRIDARLQMLFEMVVFEAIGPFEDLPLPLGLLFDVEGVLSVIYLGGLTGDEVRRDGELASSSAGQPTARWPVALTGGRWAQGHGPRRSLPNLRSFLRKQGFRSVAAELKAEERRRGQ